MKAVTPKEEARLAYLLGQLERRTKELALQVEKMRLAEYVRLLEHPWRLMYVNFISGVARGLGIAVGFALLSSILLYFLRMLVTANLPGIGRFIAEIVRMVEMHLY
ncbi:DUF5665 domain-containing protein [Ammonifex thiophilus]|uniref:Uncharacterized protein n=1 Tax=Ammonifex thiophilus TaxID=444093 RepID=A0A3D8P599_9THEO|nr:DUF5665 domain-containing protein [Ammonifex thiophilus]RDV83001.1 hypothetical protein DXX99_06275 [Ammonifex thiophilus]